MKCSSLISLAIAAAFSGLASNAGAGGFAIGTQSGSGTGNAFAGGAAAADDASVVWSNPAGMGLLPPGKHVAAAAHFLKPSFKFTNTGSTGAFAAPGTGEGGDGGDWAVVPNGFYAMDLNPRLRVGVALNVPFGLVTNFDRGWRGQFTALKSEIKTVNVNPAVAYKITDAISIGGGVSVQKIDAELSAFAGAAGVFTLKADDVAYGFNGGVMIQLTPNARVGMSYRSSIKYDLEGDAVFSGVAALNGNIMASLKVPASASFSVFHTLDPKWELMADVTWTDWSSLQQLTVIRTTASAGGGVGSTLTTLGFEWKDTWRFGLGANYKVNDQWKFRFGVAYDETPTKDATRTPRLPDQQRTWVAVGVQYRPWKAGVFELGYAHEFIRDANINTAVTGVPGALIGKFDNKADILSIQYSHSF